MANFSSVDVYGNLTLSAGGTQNIVPIGTIMMWPNTTIPAGFLLCDGSSISTTTYASLFAATGYSFGGSGGSFNLPNMVGRHVMGSN